MSRKIHALAPDSPVPSSLSEGRRIAMVSKQTIPAPRLLCKAENGSGNFFAVTNKQSRVDCYQCLDRLHTGPR